jgi:hypothetical protein
VTGYVTGHLVVTTTTDGQATEGKVRVQAAVARVTENWVVTVDEWVKMKAKRVQVMEETGATFCGHRGHDTFRGGHQGRLVDTGPPHPGH